MKPASLALHGGLDAVLLCQQRVIRRDQALVAGIAESTVNSLVARGSWKRILPRVYSVGADVDDPLVRVRAGWLWAGDDSVVCGPAAAWWIGLNRQPPKSIHLAVPPTRRMSDWPGFVVVRTVVSPSDAIQRERITVTTAARTCLDLARMGHEDLLESALRERRFGQSELEASLQLSRGRPGQVLARTARAAVADSPWSHPERLAHQLLHAAGIAGWTGNALVQVNDARFFPDISFDDVKLLVEIDGRAHHSSPEAFEADRHRQNQLVTAGWTVLRFTPTQLAENPDEFVATVLETLTRLGRK